VRLHHLLGRELIVIAVVEGQADDCFGTAAPVAGDPPPNPTSNPTARADVTAIAISLCRKRVDRIGRRSLVANGVITAASLSRSWYDRHATAPANSTVNDLRLANGDVGRRKQAHVPNGRQPQYSNSIALTSHFAIPVYGQMGRFHAFDPGRPTP